MLPLIFAIVAAAAPWPGTVSDVATELAGRSIAAKCYTAADWPYPANAEGINYPGTPVIHLRDYLCDYVMQPSTLQGAHAVRVILHEIEHANGEYNECLTERRAWGRLRAAMSKLGWANPARLVERLWSRVGPAYNLNNCGGRPDGV